MTTGLTTAATLAVMLLHALFGCCWHHEHTSRALSSAEVSLNSVEDHHDHGGCCGGHHSDDQPGHEDGDPDCCEGECQFLGTSKVVLRTEKSGTLLTAVVHQSAAGMLAQAGVSRLDRSDGCFRDAGPALRRLTQLCVWRV